MRYSEAKWKKRVEVRKMMSRMCEFDRYPSDLFDEDDDEDEERD
jgi:hypothetical protein